MMKSYNFYSVLIVVLIVFQSCTTSYLIKKGYVNPKDFHEKLNFETIKTVMIVPVEIDGTLKNFIFDTGGQISAMQRDSMIGDISDWGGASKRRTNLGSEYVKSLKIGNVDFIDTYAGNTDFVGLKEQIPNFGGLIGQPVISKANWLFDYPNKRLEVSNKELVDDSFRTIKIHRKGGSPHTFITIDGKTYEVIIDFGSSTPFNVPKDSDLSKALFAKYKFIDNERERYTLGGIEKFTEKVSTLPVVQLGGLAFKNVAVNVNVTSEARLGVSFFKDYIIYIDNTKNVYRIKSSI